MSVTVSGERIGIGIGLGIGAEIFFSKTNLPIWVLDLNQNNGFGRPTSRGVRPARPRSYLDLAK